jgi:hypothetical protein
LRWGLALLLFTAAPAPLFGGVLSSDPVIRCGMAGGVGNECSNIAPSRMEGKFGLLMGLDGAIASRTPSNSYLTYTGPSQPGGKSGLSTHNLKLKKSSGFRIGTNLRIHLFEWLGLSGDVGIDMSSIATETDATSRVSHGTILAPTPTTTTTTTVEQSPYDSFNLSYGGGYAGGSLFLPVQKLTNSGFFLSLRQYLSKDGEVKMLLMGSEQKSYAAEPLGPIREVAIGGFLSIFYLTYTLRQEKWVVTPNAGESFSTIDNKANGFELGMSGPIWSIWP